MTRARTPWDRAVRGERLPDRHPEAWEFERAAWRHFAARFPAVMRASESGGFAPILRGHAHILLTPDLFVVPYDAYPFFVDAKWKTESPTMRVWGNCRTTGIDFDKLMAYQEVERVTGQPVWLLFGHKTEDEVRIASLEGYRQGIGAGSDMVYWDYDRLPLYQYSYTQIMEAPEPTQTVIPEAFWKVASERILQRPLPGAE